MGMRKVPAKAHTWLGLPKYYYDSPRALAYQAALWPPFALGSPLFLDPL